jgi:hypothetical protein
MVESGVVEQRYAAVREVLEVATDVNEPRTRPGTPQRPVAADASRHPSVFPPSARSFAIDRPTRSPMTRSLVDKVASTSSSGVASRWWAKPPSTGLRPLRKAQPARVPRSFSSLLLQFRGLLLQVRSKCSSAWRA